MHRFDFNPLELNSSWPNPACYCLQTTWPSFRHYFFQDDPHQFHCIQSKQTSSRYRVSVSSRSRDSNILVSYRYRHSKVLVSSRSRDSNVSVSYRYCHYKVSISSQSRDSNIWVSSRYCHYKVLVSSRSRDSNVSVSSRCSNVSVSASYVSFQTEDYNYKILYSPQRYLGCLSISVENRHFVCF